MAEENKKIKIVDGDGSTLDISPVYNHIKDVTPKPKNNKKNIIVPNEKKIEKKIKKRFIVMNFIYYKSFLFNNFLLVLYFPELYDFKFIPYVLYTQS